MDKELFAHLTAIDLLLSRLYATHAIAQSKSGTNAVWWLEAEQTSIFETLDNANVTSADDAAEVISLVKDQVRELIGHALRRVPQSHHDAANSHLTATIVGEQK